MSQKKYKTKFPVSKIKKIMQSDEEIGKMTQNTPVVISAAVELFIKSIVSKACQEAQSRKASRISLSHLKKCICSTDQFDFLKDLVSDVPDPTEMPSEPIKSNGSKTSLLPPNTSLGLTPIYTIPSRPKPAPPVTQVRPPPVAQFPPPVQQQHTFSAHMQPIAPGYPPPQHLPNPHQAPYPYPFEYGPEYGSSLPHYPPHPPTMPTFQSTWAYNPGSNEQQ